LQGRNSNIGFEGLENLAGSGSIYSYSTLEPPNPGGSKVFFDGVRTLKIENGGTSLCVYAPSKYILHRFREIYFSVKVLIIYD
jgi:hypothetical protein